MPANSIIRRRRDASAPRLHTLARVCELDAALIRERAFNRLIDFRRAVWILSACFMIYWFTGQPGAGKTTLATALKVALHARGYPVLHLDGDEVRRIMDNEDYSEVGRRKNITAAQRLAAKIEENGLTVVASLVSPYRQLREDFKEHGSVVEIYVHTSEIRGREKYFVSAYEPPLKNFLDLDTTGVSVEQCLEKILNVRPLPPSPFLPRG